VRAPRESDLVAQCLALLQLRRIPSWRVNSGAAVFPATGTGRRRFVRFASAKGLSDIIGLLPAAAGAAAGRFLAIETKLPGRKLTADQAAFLERVRAAGGLALVVTDVAELQAALDGEGCQP
jgi:hypothetical protein